MDKGVFIASISFFRVEKGTGVFVLLAGPSLRPVTKNYLVEGQSEGRLARLRTGCSNSNEPISGTQMKMKPEPEVLSDFQLRKHQNETMDAILVAFRDFITTQQEAVIVQRDMRDCMKSMRDMLKDMGDSLTDIADSAGEMLTGLGEATASDDEDSFDIPDEDLNARS